MTCRALCPRCRRRYLILRKRRKRRRIALRKGADASVGNGATIDGPVSGLINIIIQVPVNTGDATSLSESNQNSLTNAG